MLGATSKTVSEAANEQTQWRSSVCVRHAGVPAGAPCARGCTRGHARRRYSSSWDMLDATKFTGSESSSASNPIVILCMLRHTQDCLLGHHALGDVPDRMQDDATAGRRTSRSFGLPALGSAWRCHQSRLQQRCRNLSGHGYRARQGGKIAL